MKLSHKLCGAALVAAAGFALVLPNTTKADESNTVNGDGHVAFTFTDDPITFTDPGSTSGSEIFPTSYTNPGPIGVIAVTPLEFGTHSVVGAETKKTYDVEKYQAPTTPDGSGTPYPMQNWVKFQDYRGQATHQYKLKANIEQPFQATGGLMLKGAEITYSNLWVANDNLSIPVSLDPNGVASTATLVSSEDGTPGASVDFIDNTGAAGEGYGQFTLSFGDQTTAEKSVELNIENSGNIVSGDYNAVIKWVMEYTP